MPSAPTIAFFSVLLAASFGLPGCSFLAFQYKGATGKHYRLTQAQAAHYEDAKASLAREREEWRRELGASSESAIGRLTIARRECEAYEAMIGGAPPEPVRHFKSAADVLRDDRRHACAKADGIRKRVENDRRLDAHRARLAEAEAIQEGAQATELARRQGLSKRAVVKFLLRRSQGRYRGRCPCPFHADARGRRCGARSAYSRHGGGRVLCYPRDIKPEMIESYRQGRT